MKNTKYDQDHKPDGASLFVAINDNAFSEMRNDILLHASIDKISAYASHLGYKKSTVVSLDINFEPYVFTGTTTVFPNPASDHPLTFTTESSYRGLIKLTLLDQWGTTHYSTEQEKADDTMEIEIDLSSFNEGFIFMNLNMETAN